MWKMHTKEASESCSHLLMTLLNFSNPWKNWKSGGTEHKKNNEEMELGIDVRDAKGIEHRGQIR